MFSITFSPACASISVVYTPFLESRLTESVVCRIYKIGLVVALEDTFLELGHLMIFFQNLFYDIPHSANPHLGNNITVLRRYTVCLLIVEHSPSWRSAKNTHKNCTSIITGMKKTTVIFTYLQYKCTCV